MWSIPNTFALVQYKSNILSPLPTPNLPIQNDFFWNDGFLSLNFRSSRAIKQIHLINFCVLKIHYIALQTESCDTTTNYNYNTLVCIARCSSSLLSPHTPKYSSVSYYSVYYFLLRWCLYSSSRLFWPVLRSFCIMASTTMYKDPYQ